MKHLLTVTALLISSFAMGQWPSLPYNPDDNADGLIGVADLQTLLANYGSEFASAVVSEDGESAIVYMGEMAYPPCAVACRNLPGMWDMPDLEDLGLVWNEVFTTNSNVSTWLKRNTSSGEQNANRFISDFGNSNNDHETIPWSLVAAHYRCYCVAKQLPRVEFYKCVGNGSDAVEECVNCVSTKLSEGWQLLPPGGSSVVQDLWRWAE